MLGCAILTPGEQASTFSEPQRLNFLHESLNRCSAVQVEIDADSRIHQADRAFDASDKQEYHATVALLVKYPSRSSRERAHKPCEQLIVVMVLFRVKFDASPVFKRLEKTKIGSLDILAIPRHKPAPVEQVFKSIR
jgi:hypothetical protein